MKGIVILFCVFQCEFYCSEAWIPWSKNYNLRAVLTVPSANLSEPYQVWVDGDSKKSRVDFYGGMDKLYRQQDNETYEYYKIFPMTTKKFKSRRSCSTLPPNIQESKIYLLNTYLPVYNFKYLRNEIVKDVEAQKWEYVYVVDKKSNTTLRYTMWVDVKNANDKKIYVPLRYIYEYKCGGNQLDYIRHDYSYFDDSKPSAAVVEKPSGLNCPMLPLSYFEEIDPLMEYIVPRLEHSRISKAFDRFKEIHNKKYRNKEEHSNRLDVFKNNLRYISSFNRQHKSFTLGINHFSDLTYEEVLIFLGTLHSKSEIEKARRENNDVGDDNCGDDVSLDWREYGAITPIKDQTVLCGSCYAFTAVAAIESASFIARGCKNLTELSEQAIIDCSWKGDVGNLGCMGGSLEYTLKWISENGVPLQEEYGHYLANEGRCHIMNMTRLVAIQTTEKVPRKTCDIKKALKKNGPLLAAINTWAKTFSRYTGGIYDDPTCEKAPELRSHGVTLIGYGKEGDKEYWIIKNTFGQGWGEKGYMRLAIKDNVCGLQNWVYSAGYLGSKKDNCTKKLRT